MHLRVTVLCVPVCGDVTSVDGVCFRCWFLMIYVSDFESQVRSSKTVNVVLYGTLLCDRTKQTFSTEREHDSPFQMERRVRVGVGWQATQFFREGIKLRVKLRWQGLPPSYSVSKRQ